MGVGMSLEDAATLAQSRWRGHKVRFGNLNMANTLHLGYEVKLAEMRLQRRRMLRGLIGHLCFMALLIVVIMFQQGAMVTKRHALETAMKTCARALHSPSRPVVAFASPHPLARPPPYPQPPAHVQDTCVTLLVEHLLCAHYPPTHTTEAQNRCVLVGEQLGSFGFQLRRISHGDRAMHERLSVRKRGVSHLGVRANLPGQQ